MRRMIGKGGGTLQVQWVEHTFDPCFDAQSQVLLLGSIPSPKSREMGFYYGHPQNRMWKVLAALMQEPVPMTVEQRKDFLYRHHIAMWDVLAGCKIAGADDASIREPQPNDMQRILQHAPIRAIYTTGGKAHTLYQKYVLPVTGRQDVPLPSTSPANCRYYHLENLIEAYRVIRDALK